MLSEDRARALSEAVFEAKRFVKRAKEALRDSSGSIYGGSISAASARRSSLDLSRALAKWRQMK